MVDTDRRPNPVPRQDPPVWQPEQSSAEDDWAEDWLDPLLEAYLGFELRLFDERRASRGDRDPCQGCRYYHGRTYGGNHLVCAMHPHGWEGEDCPDWQAFTGNEPGS